LSIIITPIQAKSMAEEEYYDILLIPERNFAAARVVGA
jgi:hypothetical protein